MKHLKPFQFKTDAESLASKRALLDPNHCLEKIRKLFESNEISDHGKCPSCQEDHSLLFSFSIELENGVTLSGEDLGDNLWFFESVIPELTHVVHFLDEYVTDLKKPLAPIQAIYFAEFCACCLNVMD